MSESAVCEKAQELKLNDVESKKENGEESGDLVTPWNVETSNDKGLDYEKLISKLNFVFLILCSLCCKWLWKIIRLLLLFLNIFGHKEQ